MFFWYSNKRKSRFSCGFLMITAEPAAGRFPFSAEC
jgi:hypothetical protein